MRPETTIAILVVDDEEAIRQVCQRTLTSLNCRVDTAEDARDALAHMKKKTYDVILTDLAMPGEINGVGLLEEIKQHSPATDVIIMTAFPALETAIPTLKNGAYDYLVKPFDQEFLRSVIRRCLEKRRLSAELQWKTLMHEELSAAYAQLKEGERLKDAFLSRVNHELRTPLTPAFFATEMLAESPLAPQQRHYCETIHSRLLQLQSIIESLLLFSEIRESEYACPKVATSLREMVDQVVVLLRPEWEKREVHVAVDFEEGLEEWTINPELTRKAIQHLVLNAIHFNKKGGHLQIRAWREKEQCHLSFSDTGIGIPQDKLSKVFDSFYQVADYLTREMGGLGLGLATVRRIVETQGGSVSVTSLEGQGSVFTMVLPKEVVSHASTMASSVSS